MLVSRETNRRIPCLRAGDVKKIFQTQVKLLNDTTGRNAWPDEALHKQDPYDEERYYLQWRV
jgi:hypothetical protein